MGGVLLCCEQVSLSLLLLGRLWAQPARAGSHSFRCFFSSLSEGVPGVPRFSAVVFVDDVPIAGYSSETRRLEPRAPWAKKIVDPQHWERFTEILRGTEQVMRNDVKTVMERLNQTQGLHSFQEMYGCELPGDGSIGGFEQYAYDGEDFLCFDKDRMRFIATATPAQAIADRRNSEKSFAQRWKASLERECIPWLQKYLQYVEESLLRREKKSSGPSIGLIAGVILGVALAVGLAALGVYYACYRNNLPANGSYNPPIQDAEVL